MEQINTLAKKQVEVLARSTKEHRVNTKVLDCFADFQTKDDPQLERMKMSAARFATDMLRGGVPYWLTLLGPCGTGKTMLAKIIARLFRTHRHERINWQSTNKTVSDEQPRGRIIRWRGGFINWGKAVNERMLRGDYGFLDDLKQFDFFAIDDIYTEYDKHRALAASKLLEVLESRLKKWTVITANLSLPQLGDQIDPRIPSRMLRDGGVVIENKSGDYNVELTRGANYEK